MADPVDIADVLDCFWNAALGSARDSQDATAQAVAGSLAEGFAAMATRLREQNAAQPDHPLVDQMLALFNGGIVRAPDKTNARGYVDRYLPREAMQKVIR